MKCWRCGDKYYVDEPEKDNGLCGECEDTARMFGYVARVVLLVFVFIAGLVTMPRHNQWAALAYICSWAAVSFIFVMYKSGWLGWIGFIWRRFKGEDNHRGEPRDS